ncbi:MAG: DUF1059 domain-containing protein [Candidatus Nanohaloarchaea archaeon]|nr:DUF1059 domain-containing protein [Candidatus Nanohaloarchaea archaeon]
MAADRTMNRQQRFECQACGFAIESEDEDELVDHAQQHGQEAHDKDVPAEAIRDKAEQV